MKFYYGQIQLEVPGSVYEPREDSLILAKLLEGMQLAGKSVLEVGGGCGLLAIIAAKKGADVTAVDINPDAVEATKANAESNAAELTALESDLFSSVEGEFDLIVFNPPYLPVEEGETDFTYAGGKTGREVIGKFIEQAKSYLKPGGTIMMVISSMTGEKEVAELFEKQSMIVSVVAREKIPWEEIIAIQARPKPGPTLREAGWV